MKRIAAFLLSYLASGSLAFAAEAAHGAVPEAGKASLPQFDITTFPSQAFWLFITFTVIYVVVKSAVMPQIGGTLEARDAHIAKELQEAGVLNEKALLLQKDYDARMAEARVRAQEDIAKARASVTVKLNEAEAKQRDVFINQRNRFVGSYQDQRVRIMAALEAEARTLAAEVSASILASASGKSRQAA